MANWYCSSAKYAAVTAWAASTATTVGPIVRQLATPAQGSERCFRCTVAGTTGTTEPTWTLTAGGSTTSGTATFVECTGVAAYNGDGGGSAWGAPSPRISIVTASGWMNQTSGDTLYVGHDHAEVNATVINFQLPGAGQRLICVKTAGSVPPVSADLRSTASITSNGTTDNVGGGGYYYGLNVYSNSVNFFSGSIFLKGVSYFENSSFNFTNSNGYAQFIGNANDSWQHSTELKNCTMSFSNTGQGIQNYQGSFKWTGPNSSITGTTVPVILITPANNAALCILDGVDLSLINTSIFGAGCQNTSSMLINCKLNASVTLATWSATPTNTALSHLDVIGCDYATTPASPYKNSRLGYAGTLTTDTVKVRTGGASDGHIAESWSITTSAGASYQFPFEAFEIPVWVDTAGSHTATVELITDNIVLTNNDVGVEAHYLGTAATPIASVVNGSLDPLRVASNLTVSSASWSGTFGTPKPQNIAVTFTTAMSGYVRLRVLVRKPSITLNVCPKVAVT